MWWDIGWDSWVGLLLGVAGLVVGVGAWVYAASARQKAEDVETAFRSFETDLEERLKTEAAKRQTAPVTHDPANFVLKRVEGKYMLINEGPGNAYSVDAVERTGFVQIESALRWREIRKGESEEIVFRNDDPYATSAVLEVTWVEYADGPRLTVARSIEVIPTRR
ncbi:hypothetical protein [Leucobacter sp. USHLN154]|uniref:hypothetical protein n=1 Tax=Leucobacter sp. USHLN154 TaxID=3081269 RepID=UPI003015EAC1